MEYGLVPCKEGCGCPDCHNTALLAEVERLKLAVEDARDLARFLAMHLNSLDALRERIMNPPPGEDSREIAVMKWPVIQGTGNQMRFLQLGQQTFNKDGVGRALVAALTKQEKQ